MLKGAAKVACGVYCATRNLQTNTLGELAKTASEASGGSCSKSGGMTVCREGWLPLSRGAGTTYGDTFIAKKDTVLDYPPGLLKHEAVHTKQWRKYGLLFGVFYGADALATGGNPANNNFEKQANLCDGRYNRASTC
jgi:hypothetical protein